MDFRKIAVIGDSHSRVFSNTPSFAPFFLGPGSDFNLVEYHSKISKSTRSLLPKIPKLFGFGEVEKIELLKFRYNQKTK